ncbi:MAG TPA: uL15m family ribosomal protein [archaeon]|nr:uL15m family ribosomal protein [archaeon]
MPATFRRKFSRMRGTKSHGWGGKKKHRGGGSQGGKGMSGMLKHKKSWMIQNDPDHFGKRGFFSRSEKLNAVNLEFLGRYAEKNKKKEIDVSELGFQKVLSKGTLKSPLKIKAKVFSEKAKQKIEEAGGEAIQVTGSV